MNPLGWKSAIYDLGRSNDSPLGEAADSMLTRIRNVAPESRVAGDDLVDGLGTAREQFASAIEQARNGSDIESIAGSFDQLVGRLLTAEHAGINSAATGHATTARVAAEDVIANLRTGIGPDAVDDSTHEALWRLRNELDEGWESLGSARIMGDLHGKTSVT